MTLSFEYFPNKKQVRMVGDNFDNIREHFSVKDDNAFFKKRFGGRFVPSRIYAITPTGLFEPGLFYDIMRYVYKAYPEMQFNIADNVKHVCKPLVNNATIYDDLNIKLRDYQKDIVKEAIDFGRGIVKLGTGGGKTLTIASLLSAFHRCKNGKMKCLLIVPDLGLVKQTFDDFIQYNVPFKITKWTGNFEPDLTSNVIIANMGVIQSRYNDEKWIEDVDILVVDECHKLKKGNKICKVITKIKTHHKFGLTGTLPDNKIDEWNIVGKIGNVFYEKNSFELRTENYLTNAEIKIIEIKYKSKPLPNPNTNDFRNELDFIYNNNYRNNVIKAVSEKCSNNVLILVNHIAHGDALFNHLKSSLKDRKVYFIRGEVEVDERASVIKEMENNNNVVCVAISAIFSTGINIKNLHMIVFAAGGKSFIRTIQSIGRGLRLNPNKQKLTIIDIADQLEYSKSHAEKRQEIYIKEKIQFTSGKLVEL
jgi:superfamily II DNA or RNA helicase